jgi:hypothetical protein
MNIYKVEFFARCPTNNVRISYALKIQTHVVIPVEKIVDYVEGIRAGFHETLADELHAAFGGEQTLVAEHHGVVIETIRSIRNKQWLDQSVGGMAGTPGY